MSTIKVCLKSQATWQTRKKKRKMGKKRSPARTGGGELCPIEKGVKIANSVWVTQPAMWGGMKVEQHVSGGNGVSADCQKVP